MAIVLSLLAQLWFTSASFAAPTGPVAVSMYPGDNDDRVPANAKLTLTFDENVIKGTGGNITVKNLNDNQVAFTYNVVDPKITLIKPDTIQIDPPASTLVADKSYYVEISPNAFLNSAGTGFAGITSATEWNFTVIPSDNIAPTATFDQPNLSTDPIKLTFNERVFANSGSIRLIRTDTNDTQVISVLSSAVTGSGLVNGSSQTVITIQPPTRLVSGKAYQMQIDNTAFVDAVGNAYIPATFPFTVSGSAITAQSLQPADNDTNVNPNSAFTARMVFGVNMVKGNSGFIYLKRVADNSTVDSINMATQASRVTVNSSTVDIQFNGTLLNNTQYYITMDPGVLKDTGGNLYEGIVDAETWNFTTLAGTDTSRPILSGSTSLIPVPGGTMASVNGSLVMKFNERVKPGSGTIVIRHTASPQSVFCSIPVTSNAMVGGGTDTLTITPSAYSGCGSFVKNTRYAVQIGSLAITDMSGNAYLGIPSSDFSTWTFIVSSDSVQPELVSTTPSTGYPSVKTSGTIFTMNFSEDIIVTGSATLIPLTPGASVVTTALNRSAVGAVQFTPVGLTAATTYVVNIPNDAITDLAGNPFPGILNDYRWTFQTIGSDRAAPVLSSAAMDGNAVVLTYNEDLDETFIPYPANYNVTVNGVSRQVNAVAIIGNTVRLTLHSGVAVGQTVKVFYTVNSDPSHKLQDLSGNIAALLNARDVTNTSDTTLARPLSGMLSGNVLTLTFNKQLAAVSNSAASQFYVKLGGSAQGASSILINGSSVVITLSTSGANAQSVAVNYTPGSTPLRDLGGNAVAGFTDFYVQNINDTLAPVLSTAAVSGSKATLTFNEGIAANPLPSKSNFSVTVNNSPALISAVAVNNNTVELSLSQAIAANAVVVISYLPGSTGIKDLAGNPAAAIYSYRVVAGALNAAKFSYATVNGSDLTITYSIALNTSSLPYESQFSVKTDGMPNTVTDVVVSGTQVALKLTAPVTANQRVTLSYFTNGIALKDSLNQTVDAINETIVTNQSSGNGNLPDYLEPDGSGGFRFINAKSSTTATANTASGRSAPRYSIAADKLSGAYAISGQLSFKVPATDTAALVALPVRSLLDAVQRNANASFRLDYGNYGFTLPLDAIDFNKEIWSAGGNSVTAMLQLSIEKAPNSRIKDALTGKGITVAVMPADFNATLLLDGREREIDNYEKYVKRTFSLPGETGDPFTVVRLDDASGEISYVPTLSDFGGGGAIVTFYRKGNGEYAVIRHGVYFKDMASHWAQNAVLVLASQFIVDGATKTTFEPKQNITRADFAEYIVRALGLDGDRAEGLKFRDISPTGTSAAYIGAAARQTSLRAAWTRSSGRMRRSPAKKWQPFSFAPWIMQECRQQHQIRLSLVSKIETK
ncbi:hypothetical protein SD71_06685 [Cohnella kolymensis]|uniref:SLH domain-containing protein n=1 Tax=Cohnella kolymensis TaxID=1590652 RepID=A0ABR5A7A6_9BACL|nr:hypothetical protein SD71_06685 [Cohnella kolymensis]